MGILGDRETSGPRVDVAAGHQSRYVASSSQRWASSYPSKRWACSRRSVSR